MNLVCSSSLASNGGSIHGMAVFSSWCCFTKDLNAGTILLKAVLSSVAVITMPSKLATRARTPSGTLATWTRQLNVGTS